MVLVVKLLAYVDGTLGGEGYKDKMTFRALRPFLSDQLIHRLFQALRAGKDAFEQISQAIEPG